MPVEVEIAKLLAEHHRRTGVRITRMEVDWWDRVTGHLGEMPSGFTSTGITDGNPTVTVSIAPSSH